MPGEVTADAESIVLTIPAERYDPALRRAGVDRDPGWVPWLERRVRLDFGGEEY